MTKDDILNMEAGKVLDELVATHVMDWRFDTDWNCYIPPKQTAKPWEMWSDWEENANGDFYRRRLDNAHVSGIIYSGDSSRIIMPEWSKDIEAAWLVVDKMRDNGYWFTYRNWVVSDDTMATFTYRMDKMQRITAYNRIAAAAICKAAIVAMSYPV